MYKPIQFRISLSLLFFPALLYVIFLIMFATSLAVKSRRFRDNYREAKYIGILLAVSIPIWLAWIMASVVLHESFHAACVGELL